MPACKFGILVFVFSWWILFPVSANPFFLFCLGSGCRQSPCGAIGWRQFWSTLLVFLWNTNVQRGPGTRKIQWRTVFEQVCSLMSGHDSYGIKMSLRLNASEFYSTIFFFPNEGILSKHACKKMVRRYCMQKQNGINCLLPEGLKILFWSEVLDRRFLRNATLLTSTGYFNIGGFFSTVQSFQCSSSFHLASSVLKISFDLLFSTRINDVVYEP